MTNFETIDKIYNALKNKGYLTNYEAFNLAIKIQQTNILSEANELTIEALGTLEVISESLDSLNEILIKTQL